MSAWPSARTTLVGVMGDPVRHSLSPLLYNSAFRALGIDWVSLAFPVVPADLPGALEGVRALGVRGVGVTMPHKEAATKLVDRVSPTVERLGALNCLVVEARTIVGESTDGAGFVESLRHGAGFDPAGRRALVAGTGGASRAVVLALADAGACDVAVVGRDPARTARAAAIAPGVARVGTASDARDADLVVNATPAGMTGTAAASTLPPVDPDLLRAGQVVADLVYHPSPTRWLELAAARGATTLGGLGMLVHQAARNLELWTGLTAPVEVMWHAVAPRIQAGGRAARTSSAEERVGDPGAR